MRDPISGHTTDQSDMTKYNPQICQRTKQEAMSPCRFMVALALRYKLWVLESHDMFTLL